jgi:hypothetical protein
MFFGTIFETQTSIVRCPYCYKLQALSDGPVVFRLYLRYREAEVVKREFALIELGSHCRKFLLILLAADAQQRPPLPEGELSAGIPDLSNKLLSPALELLFLLARLLALEMLRGIHALEILGGCFERTIIHRYN